MSDPKLAIPVSMTAVQFAAFQAAAVIARDAYEAKRRAYREQVPIIPVTGEGASTRTMR